MAGREVHRLDPAVFGIDLRMREGRYTDAYFLNVAEVLQQLAREQYRFAGRSPRPLPPGLNASDVAVGDIIAEMQFFAKRQPFAIACGVDHALAILKLCAGCRDRRGRFRPTAGSLEVQAVPEGVKLMPWLPALRVAGWYRDFAILETPMLGVLSRQTKVATIAYELHQAAGGKPVMFFPARFDLPATQSADGWAYKTGVEAYNRDAGQAVPLLITTEAQGAWWGGQGSGTTSHSFMLSFLGDTAEAMMQFARLLPADVKRVALVDTNNDCVRDTMAAALRMFGRYCALIDAGRAEEARKYVLYGVRCDTAGEVRDASVEPTDADEADNGVQPRLIHRVRQALDELAESADVRPESRGLARRFFREVKIVASGGFDALRIARFENEKVPVDAYGVGSAFFAAPPCDYTADIVRVKLGGQWTDMAKIGRRRMENPDLEPVV